MYSVFTNYKTLGKNIIYTVGHRTTHCLKSFKITCDLLSVQLKQRKKNLDVYRMSDVSFERQL